MSNQQNPPNNSDPTPVDGQQIPPLTIDPGGTITWAPPPDPATQSATGQSGQVITTTGNGQTIWITLPNATGGGYPISGNTITVPTGTHTIQPHTFTTVYHPTTGWYFSPQPAPATEAAPVEEKKIEPCICAQCNTLNEYALPNQEDGSYICYSCRH